MPRGRRIAGPGVALCPALGLLTGCGSSPPPAGIAGDQRIADALVRLSTRSGMCGKVMRPPSDASRGGVSDLIAAVAADPAAPYRSADFVDAPPVARADLLDGQADSIEWCMHRLGASRTWTPLVRQLRSEAGRLRPAGEKAAILPFPLGRMPRGFVDPVPECAGGSDRDCAVAIRRRVARANAGIAPDECYAARLSLPGGERATAILARGRFASRRNPPSGMRFTIESATGEVLGVSYQTSMLMAEGVRQIQRQGGIAVACRA